MSTTEIAVPSSNAAARRADFISQSTAVEQSRAVAEVQAMVLVAQQVPRSIPQAIADMRESCQQMGLAERAFFRFPRAGGAVSGPSVHLARELARCWGNIDYGITELRRDDVGHYSEMQAWAWDMQTNARTQTKFVVPHMRDKRGGPEVLTDLRDVYENNANQGARRVRETIFAILPTWFTEEAKAICTKTMTDGGGKPVATRVADALSMFEGIGVRTERLERKFGASASWTPHDLAQLAVSFKSIREGTVTIDDEFPQDRVTTDDVAPAVAAAPAPVAQEQPVQAAPPVAAQPAEPEPTPAPAEPAQRPPTQRQMSDQIAQERQQPKNQRQRGTSTPADAGAEYGEVVRSIDDEPPGKAETMSGAQMIVHLAGRHGVDTGDGVARMCTQVIGREVVGPKDLSQTEQTRVVAALQGLGDGVDFVFADSAGGTVPAPVTLPDAKAADAGPAPLSPQQSDADGWREPEWREYLGSKGVRLTEFWKFARPLVKERSGQSVGNADELAGLGLGDELRAWIDAAAEGQS